jgi:hypothetical protein
MRAGKYDDERDLQCREILYSELSSSGARGYRNRRHGFPGLPES